MIAQEQDLRRPTQLAHSGGTSEHEIFCQRVEKVVVEAADLVSDFFHQGLQQG